MDDRPPVLLAEYGTCHRACASGHPELLLLAPLTTDLFSLRLDDSLISREKRLELTTFTFCFGLVTLLFKKASPLDVRDSHSNSEEPSIIHLWSNENLEKLLASSYSRALLVAILAACYLGAATTQSIEHYWVLCSGYANLTADGVSSGVFHAVGLRLLCSILSLQHTQPGRGALGPSCARFSGSTGAACRH
jgi:hypothetical protein